MLTELRIQNFKAWKDTGPVRMAPLTVIFGANSAGKSSLGHLLLALKQTARLTDRKRALHLGDLQSDIDLGTFADCLHNHDLKAKLSFTLAWKPPQQVTIRDSHAEIAYTGESLRLQSSLRADERGLPKLESFRYEVLAANQSALTVEHGFDQTGKPSLSVRPMRLVMKQGRKWPIEAPEKFYRLSDVTLARFQNADALALLPLEVERLLEGLIYLGPLREPPRRSYHWAGDTVPDVGVRGEYAIAALLAAADAKRELNRGPRKRRQRFDSFIAAWLKDLGVIDSFVVRPIAKGRKEYEVVVRTRPNAPEVKLTDVGFGVSQVLPALVQAFYAPPHSTVWMEQPEIHLHPRVQAELADAFISAVQAYENGMPRGVQLVVESHSEHLLLRLQRRVADGTVNPADVAIYFVRDESSGAAIEELKLDMFGEIENWPEAFFGDDLGEITERTSAAMRRRIGAAAKDES
jgi:predicted ATPase